MQVAKGRFLGHAACPKCGSRDNVAVYENKLTCFSPGCDYYQFTNGDLHNVDFTPSEAIPLKMEGYIRELPERRISEETAKRFGITSITGLKSETTKHSYPYYNKVTGELTASKNRDCKTKQMPWTGDRTDIGMFGRQLCTGRGKSITITEGELDAAAFCEMMGPAYQVVSLKNGVKGAVQDIKEDLEFLEGYDSIVISFDMDEYGDKGWEAVKDLFTPGKVRRMIMPASDANQCLIERKIREFKRSFFDAKIYEPDGVVSIASTWENILAYKNTPSVPWPWAALNAITRGLRTSEIITIISGTGMGKSQLLREIQNHLVDVTDWRIGILALEESIARTVLGLMSMKCGRPLHLEEDTPEEFLRAVWEQVAADDRYVLLEHMGVRGMEKMKARMRYMAKSRGCKALLLDHLHIVLSAVEGASNDWSKIDELMTDLRSLAHELDVALFVVSHVSRGGGGGPSHEEGGRLHLSNIRGSQGIAQLSDLVLALERNQQAEDERERNTTCVRVLKNRFTGETGVGCYLYYDKETGRMTETGPVGGYSDAPAEF